VSTDPEAEHDIGVSQASQPTPALTEYESVTMTPQFNDRAGIPSPRPRPRISAAPNAPSRADFQAFRQMPGTPSAYEEYSASSRSANRSLTTARLTFSVGVSSPSSTVRSRSRIANFLTCST
jgi:hypothetical protein